MIPGFNYLRHFFNKDKRSVWISLLFGFAFGSLNATGYCMHNYGELILYKTVPYLVFAISFVFACLIMMFLLHTEITITNAVEMKSDKRKIFIIIWISILVCWFIVYLGVYPGFFVYDAVDEYRSVADHMYTTHHPILHTILLGGSVDFGGVYLGNYNYGIAIYIICQMLILSSAFSWIVSSTGYNYLVSAAWYGLFPVVIMFALCSVKDTLFSIALLGFSVLSVKYISDKNSNYIDKIRVCSFALIMMLFRNNGIYAYAVYSLIVGIYFCKIKGKKLVEFISMTVITILIYVIINTTLLVVTNAQKDGYQELLTVPIQQVAAVYNKHYHEIDSNDVEVLYEVLPGSVLNKYRIDLSDPVKFGFDNEKFINNPYRYFRLWGKWLKNYPTDYIEAWLGTCYGFFYPNTIVNVYRGNTEWTYTYTESSYFGYEVEYPGERHSFIPAIDDFYRWLSLDDDIQRLPIVSFPFSMGGMFWLYVACMCKYIYSKRYNFFLGFLALGIVWLTFLAGPTFLPRYTVYFWFSMPYLLNTAFFKVKENK